MKIAKLINQFVKLAEIPDYPKCKKCGDADPYLDDNGLCYKCYIPPTKKDEPIRGNPKEEKKKLSDKELFKKLFPPRTKTPDDLIDTAIAFQDDVLPYIRSINTNKASSFGIYKIFPPHDYITYNVMNALASFEELRVLIPEISDQILTHIRQYAQPFRYSTAISFNVWYMKFSAPHNQQAGLIISNRTGSSTIIAPHEVNICYVDLNKANQFSASSFDELVSMGFPKSLVDIFKFDFANIKQTVEALNYLL